MARMKMGAKAKNPKKTLKRVLGEVFKGRPFLILFILICVAVSSISTVYMASFVGEFIDNFVTPIIGVTDPDWMPAIMSLVKFGLVVGIATLFGYLQSFVMVGITQKSIFRIRKDLFHHMETLSLKYFDTNAHGALISRFSNDTDTLNQLMASTIVNLINSALTSIFVFVAMVKASWLLTIIVILFIFLTVFVVGFVGKKASKNFGAQQKSLGEVNGFIEEMIESQRVVKVFCHEEESKKEFGVLNEKLRVAMSKANAWANSMMPISGNIGNLQYVVLVLIGGALTIKTGWFTIGMLATFLQLSKSFSNGINSIMQQSNSILIALAGAERIYELEDEEPEKDDGTVTLVNLDEDGKECECKTGHWGWKVTDDIVLDKAYSVKSAIDPERHKGPRVIDDSEWFIENGKRTRIVPLKGEVIIKDVDFGYNDDKTVLHDISLFARPGEKIAFVGSTGAGKTTITNLLNRFYNIKEGVISFDGIDIKDIKLDDLRHSLGMILQDTNLFTGTIRDNIRFGKLDATEDEIVAAAKLSNAHDFIMMMPQGYDTVIDGSGEGLSQGQRQLLSIARAAIADPPVLVMDEATSSIDTHTESLVQEGMDKLMENRTVFVIAHRLSTVRNSDAIMVLEHGRIIERGNHESLLEKKGEYYELYTGKTELE